MTVKLINSTIAGPLTLSASYSYTTIRPIGGVTIATDSGVAVEGPPVFGETWTLENAGTIAASGNDGTGVYLYNGTVINSGLITAGLYGVEIKEGGVVTNVAGGTILSRNDDGVRFKYAAGTLVNNGLVSGGQVGVFDYPGGVITNLSQGTITGGNYGIGGYGAVINAGTIAGGSTADNAVTFVAGTAARLIVDPGAVFIGTVNGGNTIGGTATSTLEFAYTAGQGTLAGLGSHYVNFGQISIDTGAKWTISGSNSIVAGQTLTNSGNIYGDGTITNSGLVDTTSAGIVQYGGLFINDGSITAGGLVGVTVLSGAVVTNSTGGRITGGSFDGVQVHAGGTFVNAGYVSSGTYGGAYAYPGGVVTNLAGGTLKGSQWGFSDSGATLVNAGTIAAPNSLGNAVIASVYVAADSRVVVDPGAVFIGTVDGGNVIGAAYVSTLEFASASSYGTFSGLGSKYVNFAEVTVDAGAYWTATGSNTVVVGQTLTDSGYFYTAGDFTNDGVIDAVSSAPIFPDSGTFVNAGTVIASGEFAIDAPPGSTSPVTIANTGFISGTRLGVFLGDRNSTLVNDGYITGGTHGVYGNTGTNVVVNNADGTIAGAQLGFYGYGTVTNAGTIAAGGTSGTSVDFYAGADNELIVVPGAVFTGTVNGGNTIGAAQTSTLDFTTGAEAGYFAGIGSQYINFGQVSIDAGAAWTASGVNTIVAGQTLTDLGSFFDAGTLTNAGLITVGTNAIGQNGGVFVNDAAITTDGGNVAINAYSNAMVSNSVGATITGGGWDGVQVGSGATLVNAGLIIGAAFGGVYGYPGGVVTNLAGGTIVGGGIGFDGFGFTLVNAGTIAATYGGDDAVYVRSGADASVVVDPGAVFTGAVYSGNTIGSTHVSTLEFASATSVGTFAGLGYQYVNFAQVSIDSGAHWHATGVNVLVSGATMTEGGFFSSFGPFTNDGYINVTGNQSLNEYGGTFGNDGRITVTGGAGYALYVEGGLVTNAATASILGGAKYGVQVLGNSTLTNAGVIRGGTLGGVNADGSTVTNLAGGTIAGSNYGFAGDAFTLVNAGTVAAPNSGDDAVTAAPLGNVRVVVDPGAVFIGTVDGGNTVGGSYISTLEFAAGTGAGTLAGLGSQYVNFADISIDAGAAWTASGVNTLAGGYTLYDAGSLTLASGLAGGGELFLSGSGVTLVAEGGAAIGPSIGDLAHNTIELLGTVEHFAGFSGGELTLDGGTTLALAGSYTAGQVSVSNDGSNTFIVACFAAGTRIEGAFGPVPVEALREGDLVRNFAGQLVKVRWLGHRRTDLARHKRPHDVMPVRVRAGAFGDLVPARDLVLSPDHAVFVDGRLVPIRYLINGQSIVQESRKSVTYWHVELERHDVILAEGMPCETFLDTGNRSAFENAKGAVQMTPEFARAVWAAEGCAPIVTDPADPVLRALHLRLLARARQALAA